MEYTVLLETAPVFAIWIAPFLALGIAIFAVLVLFAWLHDLRTAEQ